MFSIDDSIKLIFKTDYFFFLHTKITFLSLAFSFSFWIFINETGNISKEFLKCFLNLELYLVSVLNFNFVE